MERAFHSADHPVHRWQGPARAECTAGRQDTIRRTGPERKNEPRLPRPGKGRAPRRAKCGLTLAFCAAYARRRFWVLWPRREPVGTQPGGQTGSSGSSSVVELHLAKVDVAGSTPVSRSISLPSGSDRGRRSQVVRRRSAKPLFTGSNPVGASRFRPVLGHLARIPTID